MAITSADIKSFLIEHPNSVLVTITETKGSTPREKGAWMIVSETAILGTIGGGDLEWQAIQHARANVAPHKSYQVEPFILGPEVGQCCGGQVKLEYSTVDQAIKTKLLETVETEKQQHRHIYLFGAGHIGRAIAAALTPLPFSLVLIDQRNNELSLDCSNAKHICTAIPEGIVEDAQPGSAYLIATHDHGLDFLIGESVLKSDSAAYVGMIGSKTKRNRFKSLFLNSGGRQDQFDKLVCPMGASASSDKSPAVIGATVAAELIAILL